MITLMLFLQKELIYVNFLANHAISKAMTIKQIKKATKQDATLQKVIEIIQNGNEQCVNMA